MKKLFSLLLVLALGGFVVGCGGDPGVSVETDVPEAELDENMDMAAGADGLGPEGEAAGAGGAPDAGADAGAGAEGDAAAGEEAPSE